MSTLASRAPRRAALLLILLASVAAAAASALPTTLMPQLHWRLLGPFRGGWATMGVGIPTQPDVYYIGTAGGGVWRTQDAGRTWQPLSNHIGAASIGAIAIAPSNPRVIYAGSGQVAPRYDIAAGDGMYRSSDGGAQWTHIGLAATRHIGAIWIAPRNPDEVVVAALGKVFGPSNARGIYRSSNGGKTWQHVLFVNDSTGGVDLAADPAHLDTLYAALWSIRNYPWLSYFKPIVGTGSAIYVSHDAGLHWHKLGGQGWPAAPLGRIGLAVTDTAAGTRIYATIDGGNDAAATGLWRSDDGGAHWQRVNAHTQAANWYFSRLTVMPGQPGTVFTTGQSVRESTDGGTTFHVVKGSPGGDDYHFVWINPLHPEDRIVASDQGAVVTLDGGKTWSSWYNQPTGQFYHLAADNRFPYWIYSGQQDSGTVAIASASDYGALSFRDWHPVGGDERDYDVPYPPDAHIVFGTGLGGRVSRWDGRTGQVQNVSPWPVMSYGARPGTVKYRYTWITPLAIGQQAP
ncbi:glycosyl hydrolase BNR repeat-containing protein, partial [mine drainage metagenome]